MAFSHSDITYALESNSEIDRLSTNILHNLLASISDIPVGINSAEDEDESDEKEEKPALMDENPIQFLIESNSREATQKFVNSVFGNFFNEENIIKDILFLSQNERAYASLVIKFQDLFLAAFVGLKAVNANRHASSIPGNCIKYKAIADRIIKLEVVFDKVEDLESTLVVPDVKEFWEQYLFDHYLNTDLICKQLLGSDIDAFFGLNNLFLKLVSVITSLKKIIEQNSFSKDPEVIFNVPSSFDILTNYLRKNFIIYSPDLLQEKIGLLDSTELEFDKDNSLLKSFLVSLRPSVQFNGELLESLVSAFSNNANQKEILSQINLYLEANGKIKFIDQEKAYDKFFDKKVFCDIVNDILKKSENNDLLARQKFLNLANSHHKVLACIDYCMTTTPDMMGDVPKTTVLFQAIRSEIEIPKNQLRLIESASQPTAIKAPSSFLQIHSIEEAQAFFSQSLNKYFNKDFIVTRFEKCRELPESEQRNAMLSLFLDILMTAFVLLKVVFDKYNTKKDALRGEEGLKKIILNQLKLDVDFSLLEPERPYVHINIMDLDSFWEQFLFFNYLSMHEVFSSFYQASSHPELHVIQLKQMEVSIVKIIKDYRELITSHAQNFEPVPTFTNFEITYFYWERNSDWTFLNIQAFQDATLSGVKKDNQPGNVNEVIMDLHDITSMSIVSVFNTFIKEPRKFGVLDAATWGQYGLLVTKDAKGLDILAIDNDFKLEEKPKKIQDVLKLLCRGDLVDSINYIIKTDIGNEKKRIEHEKARAIQVLNKLNGLLLSITYGRLMAKSGFNKEIAKKTLLLVSGMTKVPENKKKPKSVKINKEKKIHTNVETKNETAIISPTTYQLNVDAYEKKLRQLKVLVRNVELLFLAMSKGCNNLENEVILKAPNANADSVKALATSKKCILIPKISAALDTFEKINSENEDKPTPSYLDKPVRTMQQISEDTRILFAQFDAKKIPGCQFSSENLAKVNSAITELKGLEEKQNAFIQDLPLAAGELARKVRLNVVKHSGDNGLYSPRGRRSGAFSTSTTVTSPSNSEQKRQQKII